MVRFLLNDQEITISELDAQTTVLDWLRRERGLTGTKEGCASGDCGACTAVMVELSGENLHYHAINTCITFLGSLHGRQLIVVEHLADGELLHPVQQAMVDHHGSQCGFCTPGFVMSLFAMSKQTSSDNPADAAIHEYLGGNLCRCTGYRPIMDAARYLSSNPVSDRFDHGAKSTLKVLKRINSTGISENPAPSAGKFLIPFTEDDLAKEYVRHEDARLLGGGTDLALEVTQDLRKPDKLILLDRVAELRSVQRTDHHLEIGAAVSLSRSLEIFRTCYPSVTDLLLRFGSRQIRNAGTLGGNIANASPIGDLPPVLLALGALVNLRRGEETRSLEIVDFFLAYRSTALRQGEFIRSVSIPLPEEGQYFRVYKVSKRLDDDISTVCLAINLVVRELEVSSVRIALGGMDSVPRRSPAGEETLTGKQLNTSTVDATADAVVSDFAPIDDARASASYRSRVVRNLFRRFWLEFQGTDFPLQVSDVG